jgi:hypothetical protein
MAKQSLRVSSELNDSRNCNYLSTYLHNCRDFQFPYVHIVAHKMIYFLRKMYGFVWSPGQNKRITPLSFLHGYRTEGLIALTPEIDCNNVLTMTAITMGLPPVTSAVLFIANKFW